MTDKEKENNPSYKTTGGYLKKFTYKESWMNFWKIASQQKKDEILNLPYFDKSIFLEITGIDITNEN